MIGWVELCVLLNRAQPWAKETLVEIRKNYDTPQTPFSCVLVSPFVLLTAKERLSALKASYDPVVLRYNLDAALDKLHHAHNNKRLVKILYEKE